VLAVAGLLGRSLAALERLDMGFTTDRLAIVSISWPWREYDTPEETRAFYDRLMPRLNALRGIEPQRRARSSVACRSAGKGAGS
jgi:hypothetical protein